MKTVLRLAVLACTSLVGLAVAGGAMAAYQPRIVVKNPSERLGAAGPLTLRVEQPRVDDATFRLAIYVPQGYATSLVPAEGATIGTVTAQAQANAISPDAVLELTGNIVGDPTFTAAEYPQAAGCLTGSPITAPAAVYRLTLSAAGQTLIVPLYVAPITQPPLASAFSAVMIACLPSPYVPVEQGGATFGAKLINADLTLNGIFTSPSTAGDYRWSALWTPWTVGTATPNPAGTVETQSVDRLAAQLSLAVRTSRRNVTLAGSLLENGTGVPNARVQLLLGRTAAGVRSVGVATTNARGLYARTFRNRAKGVWYARTRVTVPDRTTTCVAVFAPVPCIAASVPGFAVFSNRVIRFRVR